MKTKMEDLPLTPLAPRYQKELDKINKKKMIYFEPEEYITESMREILEGENSGKSEQKQKKDSVKRKKSKTTRIIIDDGWIRRIAMDKKK